MLLGGRSLRRPRGLRRCSFVAVSRTTDGSALVPALGARGRSLGRIEAGEVGGALFVSRMGEHSLLEAPRLHRLVLFAMVVFVGIGQRCGIGLGWALQVIAVEHD